MGTDANDVKRKKGADGLLRLLADERGRRTQGKATNQSDEVERFAEGHVAQEFARTHRDRLRYCWKWKRWVAFDGRRWTDDAGAGAAGFLLEMALGYYKSASTVVDDAARKRIVSHAKIIDTAKGRRNVLELAQPEPGIGVDPDQFDRDPWLLNVNNGTLCLRAGSLESRPHNPNDYLRKLAPVDYDPEATAPTWEKFLDRIMAGNAGLIAYLQRLAGYCLTGLVSEHVLPVFYGTGRNGKSTFLAALADVLGEHLVPLPEGMLITRKHQHHPAELMTLRGARLAVSSEIAADGTLNESRVKALTGGERIQARGMHQDFGAGFDPTAKIVLVVNHRPRVRDTSAAMWRRVHLVPFEVTIAEDEVDPNLREKLAAESSGILAWAVRGCIEWQRIGLSPPEEIRFATAAYQEESDVVGRWVRERCSVSRDLSAPFASLWQDFETWLQSVEDEEGALDDPISRRAFGQRLDALGHRTKLGTGAKKYRRGLALRPSTDRRSGDAE